MQCHPGPSVELHQYQADQAYEKLWYEIFVPLQQRRVPSNRPSQISQDSLSRIWQRLMKLSKKIKGYKNAFTICPAEIPWIIWYPLFCFPSRKPHEIIIKKLSWDVLYMYALSQWFELYYNAKPITPLLIHMNRWIKMVQSKNMLRSG